MKINNNSLLLNLDCGVHFFSILCEEMGSVHKVLLHSLGLQLACTSSFFYETPLKKIHWQIINSAIQTWVFGRYCLEDEFSETVSSRKTADNFYCQRQNSSFKRKFKFGTFISAILSLTASQYLKTFPMRSEMISLNVMFWYSIKKFVNIWKICIAQ